MPTQTPNPNSDDVVFTNAFPEEDDLEDENEEAVIFQKFPLTFHDSGPKEFIKNPLKRHISVEIECDSFYGSFMDIKSITRKWRDCVVKDGSLHGSCAHEVDTAPTNGDQFVKHIKELCGAYAKIDGRCSHECGLHVHIDGRDLKFYDLRKVILLYARVEKALFGLCDPTRVDSNFAEMCGKQWLNMEKNPSEFKRQLLGKFYGKSDKVLSRFPEKEEGEMVKSNQRDKYRPVRYRALNIHSWFLRKTIEFRHHEGTINQEEIINWALICGHVVDYANRVSEAQIQELPLGSKSALLKVIPDNLQDYCRNLWKTNVIRWSDVYQKGNKPSLPVIPAEEKGLDKKTWIIKRKKERQAKAELEAARINILRALITDTLTDEMASATNTVTPF